MNVEILVEQTYLFEAERDIESMEDKLRTMRQQLLEVERLYKHGVQVGANAHQRAVMLEKLHNMREIYAVTNDAVLASYEAYRICRDKMELDGVFSTMPVLVPLPV